MKKLGFIWLSVSLSLFFVLNSCSDSESYSDADKKPINPMEKVGIEHNNLMALFTKKLEKSYMNKEWNNIDFLSEDYVDKFATLTNEVSHEYYKDSKSTVAIQKNYYNKLQINSWFKKNDENTMLDLAAVALDKEVILTRSNTGEMIEEKLTEKDKKFTKNLLLALAEVSDKEYKSEEEAFFELKKVVDEQEKIIISQKWLSNEKSALGALAIAKYSTMFWEKYDFSIYQKKNTSAMTRSSSDYSQKKKRGISVVFADTAGYVVGGVTGGLGGSFAGPAGTIGGVMGGKLAGSWLASGAAVTAFSIWDSLCDAFS